MAGRARKASPRQTPANGGARVVSAVLKNADVFKTGKGAKGATGGDPPEAVLVIRKGTGFHDKDFARKARDLKRLSDEGKLVKTKTPPRRETIKDQKTGEDRTRTSIYRYRMNRAIDRDPARREHAAQTYDGIYGGRAGVVTPGDGNLDPDHIHELQLGGKDEYENLRLMDAYTNRRLGMDIHNALASVPYGTRVRIEVED